MKWNTKEIKAEALKATFALTRLLTLTEGIPHEEVDYWRSTLRRAKDVAIPNLILTAEHAEAMAEELGE